MNFIDTHTHLYAEEFDADRETAIQRAIDARVTCMLLPAIDKSYYERMMEVVKSNGKHCLPMIGLHPGSVKENFQEELDFVRECLGKNKFYGIGEIGIDLYWDKTFEAEQVSAFSAQLDLAIEYHLPAAIHTRNSFEIAIEVIRKKNNPSLTGVFHCFTGTPEQAEQATSLGFKLGIGGVVTYKNSELPKVIEKTALEHLVLETDAPYLPPVPYRGKRNESAYIPIIARKIAELKGVDVATVAETTTRNAMEIWKSENLEI
jgi:TatD DNase family protein